MAKKIEQRINDLEKRLVPGVIPVIEAIGDEGKSSYVNQVTGEITSKLPKNGAITVTVGIDLVRFMSCNTCKP